MKQAILLAVPGTSFQDAIKTLSNIDKRFHGRFAGVRRIWSYTSSGVRQKLDQSGAPVGSPLYALRCLKMEGVTHVVVKSLHFVAGMEYAELKDLVQEFSVGPKGFEKIILSKPLLDTPTDFERTMRCLLTDLPADDALLLVAHGSKRPEAQAAYQAAATFCRRLDRRVILSTLMSNPGLEDVIRECKASGLKKLVMAPLMIVAGSSARNDLAGGDSGSWVSSLEREGISCTPIVKGLGDHDDIVRIWMDDVERMLTGFSEAN